MSIQLGTAYGKVILDSSGISFGVDNAKRQLMSLGEAGMALGDTLSSVGMGMTAAITLPLAMAGKQAFDTAVDFDTAMNILKGATGATAEEFQQLSDQAMALGADMTLPGTSAVDAAEAMAELAKAGLDVQETLDASKGVLQLAAAGQMDNAEAAEIAANALNAFNLNADETVRVADLLAAGANSSSASVKEMGYSLQMSASVASMAGIEIEDLVTSISLMANAGIQGSDAGTSLKSMLLHLQAPSKKAQELMDELGISVYDSNGNMKDMREIIQIFGTQLSGLTQQERDHALATIFGSDAVRAANIVLMQGTDAFDEMKTAVTEAGAAAQMAEAMMEGLPGAVENVKSAFETAQLAALEPFKEDIEGILKGVANLLNWFSNLPEPIRKTIVVMLTLLALTGPLLMMAGGLISFAGRILAIVQTLQMLGVTLPSLGVAFTTIGGAIGSFATFITTTAIPAIVAFGTSLWAALLPLLPLLALIAAAALLVYLVWSNWDQLKTTVWQLCQIIKMSFQNLVTDVKSSWAQFTADAKNAFQDVQNGAGATGHQIGLKIAGALTSLMQKWNNFKTQVSNVFKAIGQFFSNMMNSIVGVASNVFNGIANAISNLIGYVQQLGQSLMNLELPDALTPGSPTPFENGLKGIRKEMEALSRGSIPGLAGSLNGSQLAGAVSKPMQAMAPAQGGGNVFNLSNGLTLRDVSRIMDQKIGRFAGRMEQALGN